MRQSSPSRTHAQIAALCLVLALAGCGSAPPLTAEAEHPCAESAYVEITNTGAGEVPLADWTIKDSGGEHRLPTLLLAPQAKLRIWRGTGVDDDANLYLTQLNPTWRLDNSESFTLGSPPTFWPWESFQTFIFQC